VTASEAIAPSPCDEPVPDLGDAVRHPFAENAVLVAGLRGAQIPQQIGMAAACRTLMVDLPRELVAHVDADLASGDLAQRWKTAHAAAVEASAGGSPDPAAVALAVLLREFCRSAMRHLIARGKQWTAEAYRLEGQAAALEAQAERLRRLASPAAPGEQGSRQRTTDSAAIAG
jgi:hypothetical protein